MAVGSGFRLLIMLVYRGFGTLSDLRMLRDGVSPFRRGVAHATRVLSRTQATWRNTSENESESRCTYRPSFDTIRLCPRGSFMHGLRILF
jgi:hypothetical protein